MKKLTARLLSLIGIPGICVMAVMLIGLSACDGGGGGGGGGSSDNSSTVLGNVSSFDTSTAYFKPQPESFLAALIRLFVPEARAAAGGVSVSVNGTGINSTTESDGFFLLSGVPPGRRQILFSLGAHSGILEIDVPASSTLELRDVQVTLNAVVVGAILMQSVETSSTTSTPNTTGGNGSPAPTPAPGDDDNSGTDDQSGGEDEPEGE